MKWVHSPHCSLNSSANGVDNCGLGRDYLFKSLGGSKLNDDTGINDTKVSCLLAFCSSSCKFESRESPKVRV